MCPSCASLGWHEDRVRVNVASTDKPKIVAAYNKGATTKGLAKSFGYTEDAILRTLGAVHTALRLEEGRARRAEKERQRVLHVKEQVAKLGAGFAVSIRRDAKNGVSIPEMVNIKYKGMVSNDMVEEILRTVPEPPTTEQPQPKSKPAAKKAAKKGTK